MTGKRTLVLAVLAAAIVTAVVAAFMPRPIAVDVIEARHDTLTVTVEEEGKTRVIEDWIAQGRMDPVDPRYLIFMIWSSTQHYADFDAQVKLLIGQSELTHSDFDRVAETLTHIILKGCGVSSAAGGRA